MGQGDGQAHLHLHAPGEVPIGLILRQIQPPQQSGEVTAAPVLIDPAHNFVNLPRLQHMGQARLIQHHADLLLHRAQIAADVRPQHAGAAGVRFQHTQQQLDGGALAGAVFTDQAQNAAGGQRKVQSLQGKAGEMLGKPFDLDGVVHSSSSNTS